MNSETLHVTLVAAQLAKTGLTTNTPKWKQPQGFRFASGLPARLKWWCAPPPGGQ